jgi:acyl-homoserine lactone acylase PvdQ
MPFRARLLAAAAFAFGVLFASPATSVADDFAGDAFNVLPPGQSGSFFPGPSSVDQIPLYDGLTPKFDNVQSSDLPTFFKPNIFGLGGQTPARVEEPPQRPGLRIEYDSFNVPHIYADSRADIMFGSGWVAQEHRGLLIESFRGPGRIAAIDAPGLNAFALAGANKKFEPTAQTEQFLSEQVQVLEGLGPKGLQVINDIDNYVDGINSAGETYGAFGQPWNRNDVLASAALIGAVFGRGGGDEARRAQMLSGLRDRLGDAAGTDAWEDLRRLSDPETSATIDRPFTYNHRRSFGYHGNALVDAGSLDTSGANQVPPAQMSNALLVGEKLSRNGHPLFVAGPQVGYFYPQVLMELDLHGGGIDARGATFPGAAPYVLLGRGQDYAWSATSAGSDVTDHYVETLCGDDTHYMFNGECREMTVFDAGILKNPDTPVRFRETVHGPVIGYATVDGERVAVSTKRSTRGREVASALGFADLNSNDIDSPHSFIDAMSQIEFTFNWFYADHQDIAMFSSGRLPKRPPQVDRGLPAIGTGEYEWNGFIPQSRHPQTINPHSGLILNWNNKPAKEFGAADDNWAYGSVHRNNLLEDAAGRMRRHSLASVVAAMNRAATQDLRNARVLSAIEGVLETGPAPNARAQRMLELLQDWRQAGSSRLDVDLDTKIDHAGAAIMDAAWPRIADAVMSPVLGPQLNELASLMSRDNKANNQGSSYGSGWYGYVDKDLRTVAGAPVVGAFKTRFCGLGDLTACRDSLWAAMDAAGAELEAAQGANPDAWRASATPERIRFLPGLFLSATMRWTNRPTFQQVISFDGHR